MEYIIKHSLRTSIKRGDKETLDFLGYNSNLSTKISNLQISPKNIKLGEQIEFSFNLTSKETENLVIDYKITYPSPTKKISQKVFKIKTLKITPNKPITIIKKHTFKLMTTKKLYSGIHKLEIQINGKSLAVTEFKLKVE